MTKFKNTINKAKRRLAAARAVYMTGRALVAAIIVAITVLIVDRLMNLQLPLFTFVAIVAAGGVSGAILSLLRRDDIFSVAVLLDRRLGLRDRLGTAQAIQSGEINNNDFGELITRDAEKVAENLDVKAATPIRFSNDWSLAGILVIALGAAVAFVPSLDRASKGQTPLEIATLQEQFQQQQQEITETIEDAVSDVDDESLDDEVREDLDALKRLAGQLSNDAISQDELTDARNRSAAELGEIASRLEEQSQRNSLTIDSIAERFAGMEQTEAPMKAKEFEEALRKGEFEDASEILDELKRQAEQMNPSERDALTDHFRNMSEQISEDSDSANKEDDLDSVRDAMRDLGMDDEAIDAILDEDKTENEISNELEEQGVDEDIARDLAEDIKDSQKQEEIDQQTDEQVNNLAEALNEAADEFERQEPPQDNSREDSTTSNNNSSESEEDSTRDEQEASDKTSNDSSDDESLTQQDDNSQEGEDKGEVENEEPSQKSTGEKEDSDKQTESEQEQQVVKEKTQERNQGEQEREVQQGEQTSEKKAEKPDKEQAKEQTKEQTKEQGKEQDKQQKPGQQIIDPANPNTPEKEEEIDQQSSTEEKDIPKQNNQTPPNDQTSNKQTSSKEDPNAKKKMPKDLGKALRELAKRKSDAAKGKKISKRLREAAQKLADSLSDEEKRELAEKWMGEFNKPADNKPLPQGGKEQQNTTGSAADRIVQNTKKNLEPDIEDVDVTGEKVATKSIIEWLSDQPIEGDPQRTTQSDQVLRKARSAAEHAVGESTVPKRYHELIQRYFGKLNDTVEKAAKQVDSKTKNTPAKTTTEDDS